MKSPLKYFGSDMNTAVRINALFPPHDTYVEPFCGSLATLLAHPGDGRREIVSDIFPDLINFWCCVRANIYYEKIIEQGRLVKHNLHWWKYANSESKESDYIERALKFMIRFNFSRNGEGKAFAPSNRIRRGMPEYDSRWQTQLNRLIQAHRRLRHTMFYCIDAIDLIKQFNDPNTLMYLDPPFVHTTRQGLTGYQFEQPTSFHRKLLLTIKRSSAKIVISGNRCALYDKYLEDWRRIDFEQVNAVGGKGNKRIESFWFNYHDNGSRIQKSN